MRALTLFIAFLAVAVFGVGCNTAQMEDSLTKAVLTEDLSLAKRLVADGARVRKVDDKSPSEFAMAVGLGQYKIADVLLDAGGNVNETIDGVSLIELMKNEGREDQVKWLEARGARIKP